MKKLLILLLATALLAGGGAPPAQAALQAVSPTSAANGFPVWYRDTAGLQLDACLDTTGFCTMAPPAIGAVVFPTNFPDEFFYWSATAIIDNAAISSTPAILVLALEGAFANGPVVNGDQVVFARIRVRFTPAVTGSYTVTHPYGTLNTGPLTAGEAFTDTQDVGIAPGVFTGALAGGIGPFLQPVGGAAAFVVDQLSGNTYIANPNVLQPVQGGPNGNVFSIAGPVVTATQPLFALEGKVSNCVADVVAPVANPDLGATAAGQAASINLTANDTDVGGVGVNPAAIVVTAAPASGTVVRNINGTVTYTPNADFFGQDSFTYTVQDFCALTSNAVVVPMTVERLVAGKAEFRVRTGKWSITGESSNTTANVITLHRGSPTGPVVGTTPVQADGTWKFQGKSKVPPPSGASPQSIHVESSANVIVNTPLKMK